MYIFIILIVVTVSQVSHMTKLLIEWYNVNIYCSLYVNYTLIKLLRIKTQRERRERERLQRETNEGKM